MRSGKRAARLAVPPSCARSFSWGRSRALPDCPEHSRSSLSIACSLPTTSHWLLSVFFDGWIDITMVFQLHLETWLVFSCWDFWGTTGPWCWACQEDAGKLRGMLEGGSAQSQGILASPGLRECTCLSPEVISRPQVPLRLPMGLCSAGASPGGTSGALGAKHPWLFLG